jgi:Kef-type K+ transport system membrane component KefB
MAPDLISSLILSLAIILVAAKLGGHLAARISQPPVLGELAAGLVLGNLGLVGFRGLDFLKTNVTLDVLAQLGVILLLFQVGLESTVAQMMKVGLSSLFVGTLGVAGPFVLGWGVGTWLLPNETIYAHIFLGATLTATSVGITARVLKDLGRSQSREARIILGAGVIDDVEGLVILAVVTGMIAAVSRGGVLGTGAIALVVIKAVLFLAGSLLLGVYASPRLFALASKLQATGVLLAIGLSFCFVLAWFAGRIGLAPIVGAFAAGLVLEDLHYRDFVDRGEHTLEQAIEPIASFLVPVFFVIMGARTDLGAFTEPGVLGLAAALTAAAVLGKQLCALGVVGPGVDRWSVAIGMIPRGEVGLIFADIGLSLVVAGQPVVNHAIFSAVVVMVIVTTMITPPALAWSFARFEKRAISRRAREGAAADSARSAAKPRA